MTVARVQLYHMITAFEQDIRTILDRFIVAELGQEQALEELVVDAQQRMYADSEPSGALIDYLDLRPTYDLLNRHRDLLPSGLARELRELTQSLDVIVPIRHRVMHSRPFRENDPDQLLSTLRMFTQPQWRLLHAALGQLDDDPMWALTMEVPRAGDERVHHNLPLPEYDDTGLVGRDEEVEQLIGDLKRRRQSVLTITGEGGIGKSALALEAASRLLDDNESPFELILWVSLKTERLTSQGIESITDSIDSLIGATRVLGEAITPGFDGHLDDLAHALDGIPTLICFDNLETITGEDFVSMYERLPQDVSYLVTSRQGIGQLEKRLTLKNLDTKSATNLLNQLIRLRSVDSLSRISGEARKEIARRLRNNPLSIRWYISAIEAGGSPQALLEDQHELLTYCVGSVLDSVSDGATTVLTALHIANEPIDESQIVLLTEMRVDDVRSALQELVRGALVKYTVASDLTTTMELTEAAQRYIDRRATENDPDRLQVIENLNQARLSAKKRRESENTKRLAPWATRVRTPEDEAVATILHRALRASHRGDIDSAYDLVGEAKRLSPDYWEVYRIEAFISSSHGNTLRASASYQEAYDLANEPEHRGIVAHFFSGHLARNEGNLSDGIRLAREAHSIIASAETQRALGERLLWNGEFTEALTLLRDVVEADSGRDRLLATTSLVGALHRLAEKNLREDRNFLEAWNPGLEGWNLGTSLIDSGTYDDKLIKVTIECAQWAIKSAKVASMAGQHVTGLDELVGSLHAHLRLLLKHRRVSRRLFEDLIEIRDDFASVRGLLSDAASTANTGFHEALRTQLGLEGFEPREQYLSMRNWRTGQIKAMPYGAYGFIVSPNETSDIYFNEQSLPLTESIDDFAAGDEVAFLVSSPLDGQQPKAIALTKSRHKTDRARAETSFWTNEARVIFAAQKGYLFASDPKHPNIRIFVHASVFDTADDYNASQIDSCLEIKWSLDGKDSSKGIATTARLSSPPDNPRTIGK